MKDIKDFINESVVVNESMSTEDLLAIEKLLEKFKKGGTPDEYMDKISDEAGEGPCDEIQRMLDKYDEYMEGVMFDAVDQADTPKNLAKRIKQAAEENEQKEGTEACFVLDFLEELAKFLGIN